MDVDISEMYTPSEERIRILGFTREINTPSRIYAWPITDRKYYHLTSPVQGFDELFRRKNSVAVD